jgi:branched-chain amino acid transport system permease protein
MTDRRRTPTHPASLARVLPVVEVVTLGVMLATPFALSSRPELITLVTNILILAILALSFELCWGYSGIMSFGQALFFGVPAYVIALVGRDLEFSQLWGTLPLAMLVGLVLAAAFALFLLMGRKTPTPIFIALGTLTGAMRRNGSPRAGNTWAWATACRRSSCCRPAASSSSRASSSISWHWLPAGRLLQAVPDLIALGWCSRESGRTRSGWLLRLSRAVLQGNGLRVRRHDAGLAGALYSYHQGFIGPGARVRLRRRP